MNHLKGKKDINKLALDAKEQIVESNRELIKKAFSLEEDSASHIEIKNRILCGGNVTGTNMCILVLAIIIASIGLNTGSTAVIIGAMLISPLMGSIMAMAYAGVTADLDLFRKHIVGFAIQILISLAVSVLFFLLTPIKEPTTELLARTQPTFFDVIIAISGGLAGIIGNTRKDKANNVIPGVAIATALMPPLCTCGYSIATLNPSMLLGASYLFIVNAYFMFISSAIILSILRIPKVRELSEQEWKYLRRKMVRNTLLLILPAILMGISIWY